MESAHDQLFKAGSHDSIAFARKYQLNGPIPESLTNYLDVKKKILHFSLKLIIILHIGSILW